MDDQPTPTRLSFSIRTVLEVIAIVALVLALLYGRFDDFMGRNGRYEIYRGENVNGTERVILLDTKSGKLWMSSGEHHTNRTLQWYEADPVGAPSAIPAPRTSTGPRP